MQASKKYCEEAAEQFLPARQIKEISRYGSGHINDTFRVICEQDGRAESYLLQRINGEVFRDADAVMHNLISVTDFLREKILASGGDPFRETLSPLKTLSGGPYYRDEVGDVWRMLLFISDAISIDMVRSEEDFYQNCYAFGNFQRLLADYPVGELIETIPDFHNTPARFAAFQKAVCEDICGRVESVRQEIQFVLDREKDMPVVWRMLGNGEIPLRVTHNDTKLNNILIDEATGKALCVLDLDTVMPGTSVFDFGDAVRFGASTAAEDETDLEKVSLSLKLFETGVRGFLDGCGGCLTKTEIRMLPMGAKLMTLECGMRFLMDYLQGDIYYRIHRERHNLDRARTQFKLVADMENKWVEMEKITAFLPA